MKHYAGLDISVSDLCLHSWKPRMRAGFQNREASPVGHGRASCLAGRRLVPGPKRSDDRLAALPT